MCVVLASCAISSPVPAIISAANRIATSLVGFNMARSFKKSSEQNNGGASAYPLAAT
jgi:hypothetical protein